MHSRRANRRPALHTFGAFGDSPVNQPAYPALYDPAAKKLYSLLGAASFVVGRSETADLVLLDVTCSREQFRVVRAEGRCHVEPMLRTSPTYHNGQPIAGPTPLTHEDRLDAGESRFVFLAGPPAAKSAKSLLAAKTVVGKAAPIAPAAPPAEAMMTVMAGRGAAVVPPPPDSLQPIPLSGKMLIGRDEGRVQIHLAHPQISRVHAHITAQNGRTVLVDLSSANGTYVNGMRVRKPTTLQPGDQIDIGPYALQFDGQTLVPRTRSDNVELVARNVRRVVTNRETGKPLTLLDDITLVIRPREFVCLLGPSGSGKSTLLSALSGRTRPTPATCWSTARTCTPTSTRSSTTSPSCRKGHSARLARRRRRPLVHGPAAAAARPQRRRGRGLHRRHPRHGQSGNSGAAP